MKKPFFHSCVPGTSGVSGEPNLEANFDATNAVSDASCEPSYEATVVRDGSAPEGNTLSTLGGNPEPPEAFLKVLNELVAIAYRDDRITAFHHASLIAMHEYYYCRYGR